MNSRKDKSDRSIQHEEVLNLLPLLETPDYQAAESIKNLVHENLSGTKDSRLLYGLVDYYIAVESQRSLDILLHLKEPHDKNLFDRITELMKNETYRYKSLQLLCNLVYKQPSWLYKIANHRIMHTLLNLLKTDVNAPNLMSGLFILICFLPMIPSQYGPFLGDTFDIFSRLAAWSVKKPSFIVDVYLMHLEIAIYTLFHRLYGMFPCNFLAYLRSYYGGRDCNEENYRVFTLVIKPMLERVRLHPLLVTASKETELSANRWKKMSYHDIIVECASISLDVIEGTAESMRRKFTDSNSIDQNFCSYESAQFMSYSSQSSCSINFESDSVIQESMPSLESMGSVMQNRTMSVPSSSATSPLPLKGELEFRSYTMQLSTEEMVPLDFAVEAKPELMKLELDNANAQALSSKTKSTVGFAQKSDDKTESKCEVTAGLHADKGILQAVEAKEEDVDKEVCELTSRQDSPSKSADVRHDTPFCSTTQNLTDEPGDLPQKVSFSGTARCDSLTKSTEEAEETYNSLQDGDSDTFSPPISRIRFFSHLGPPPDIPSSCNQKPQKVIIRSVSCPANLDSTLKKSATNVCICASEKNSTTAASCNNNGSSCAPSSVLSPSQPATYESLIPMALNPLPAVIQSRNSNSFSVCQSLINSLSPPELLDRYIQLGNLAAVGQLSSIPITSTKNTDWTHFGGKPPPDEITILRNQILLLHNQLLFERHRKDVHSERNRRILGRAKRFRMQEEHIVALKEQISLLEQDNKDLKNQIAKKSKHLKQILTEKQQIEADLLARILKAEQENLQLQFSNKNLQNLLVSQKQENDEIRNRCKSSLAEITILRHQVERANRKAQQCLLIEKESIFLSKQLILLQELIGHYKEKIEVLKENRKPDYGGNMFNNAACAELRDLKQKLATKTALLDTMKTKVADLEKMLSNMKAKHKEQMQAFEVIKSLHKDEILIRQERISDLKKISVQKDAHILRLYKDMEMFTEEKRIGKEEKNGCIDSADLISSHQRGHTAGACCSHQPVTPSTSLSSKAMEEGLT